MLDDRRMARLLEKRVRITDRGSQTVTCRSSELTVSLRSPGRMVCCGCRATPEERLAKSVEDASGSEFGLDRHQGHSKGADMAYGSWVQDGGQGPGCYLPVPNRPGNACLRILDDDDTGDLPRVEGTDSDARRQDLEAGAQRRGGFNLPNTDQHIARMHGRCPGHDVGTIDGEVVVGFPPGAGQVQVEWRV